MGYESLLGSAGSLILLTSRRMPQRWGPQRWLRTFVVPGYCLRMMRVSITQTAGAAVIRNTTAMRCSKYDTRFQATAAARTTCRRRNSKRNGFRLRASACKRYPSPAARSDRRATSSASKRMHGGHVAVYSRSGNTDRFTLIANAIAAPPRMLTASAAVTLGTFRTLLPDILHALMLLGSMRSVQAYSSPQSSVARHPRRSWAATFARVIACVCSPLQS